MRYIKYFYEEPTLLDLTDGEPGSGPTRQGLDSLLRKPRHFRGYLAATDTEHDLVGGSALDDHAAARILAEILSGPVWFSNRAPGQQEGQLTLLTHPMEIVQALVTMGGASVMLMDMDPTEELIHALTDDTDRKSGMRTIAALLDQGGTLVFPEQAHTGHDWSIFSSRPLARDVREAMSTLPQGTRGYVIPYKEARGEHKFYFEQYDPELFARHEVKG